MIEQTKQILMNLKCHGILSSLETRLTEATTHGWGHGEFLSALVTDEKSYRDHQKTIRRIRAAQFRTEACFERIDLAARRNLTRTQVQDLMELRFIRDPRNVLILGPTGVGKTFLATAIGQQACRQGFCSLFVGVNHLIDRIALARADGTFLKYREKLIRADLLILDDLGLKVLPPGMIQDLYDILEERYQSKSTVITSQLPLENWKEVIDDPVALEAILDRLIHGAVTLKMEGESYRKLLRKESTKIAV
jgi:DNA replication protein DnaC